MKRIIVDVCVNCPYCERDTTAGWGDEFLCLHEKTRWRRKPIGDWSTVVHQIAPWCPLRNVEDTETDEEEREK